MKITLLILCLIVLTLCCTDQGCQLCPSKPSTCVQCAEGYLNSSSKCIPCDNIGCKSCPYTTGCTACKDGYGAGTSCRKCDNVGCRYCPSYTNSCTECLDGYGVVPFCMRCENIGCKRCPIFANKC